MYESPYYWYNYNFWYYNRFRNGSSWKFPTDNTNKRFALLPQATESTDPKETAELPAIPSLCFEKGSVKDESIDDDKDTGSHKPVVIA